MTKSNDYWSGLISGGIDARRVDPAGRHDFFWVISTKSEPGLLLRLADETPEARPLPKIRSLDISYSKVGGKNVLIIVLKDPEQRELFGSFCDDIVRAGEKASDNADALNFSIRRTVRWHHLLRGGKLGSLTLEEQRGLLGELQFLEYLSEAIGPRAAVEAWKGPLGSSKDFEMDGCLVEIKAKRGAAKPFVQISSEDQLSNVDGCRLFLQVVSVDAAVKPKGMTLTDHVNALDAVFSIADPVSYSLWEQAIEASGFDFEDDYSDRRWTFGESKHFEVTEGFPRIANPTPQGVSNVRYSISLDACASFGVAADEIDKLIIERNN